MPYDKATICIILLFNYVLLLIQIVGTFEWLIIKIIFKVFSDFILLIIVIFFPELYLPENAKIVK